MNVDDQGQKVIRSSSAFGRALAFPARAEKIRARNQKDVDDFKRCLCNARGAAQSGESGDATPTETAMVMRDASHAFVTCSPPTTATACPNRSSRYIVWPGCSLHIDDEHKMQNHGVFGRNYEKVQSSPG